MKDLQGYIYLADTVAYRSFQIKIPFWIKAF